MKRMTKRLFITQARLLLSHGVMTNTRLSKLYQRNPFLRDKAIEKVILTLIENTPAEVIIKAANKVDLLRKIEDTKKQYE